MSTCLLNASVAAKQQIRGLSKISLMPLTVRKGARRPVQARHGTNGMGLIGWGLLREQRLIAPLVRVVKTQAERLVI